MLVLTWNIRKHVDRIDPILAAIRSRGPDFVTLQEVAEGALAAIDTAFQEAGLKWRLPSMARGKGNLIASRWSLRAHPAGWAGTLPFPELLTGATIDAPMGPLELITAHMPNGAGNGEKKLEHFLALARYLEKRPPMPCIITGDFNSPRAESEDETVLCFGRPYRGRSQEWEDAEQAIITGSGRFGMRDVFREKHGYKEGAGARAYSHEVAGKRRRFDHIFASSELTVAEVQYEMDWLTEKKLSDHAALWARFA